MTYEALDVAAEHAKRFLAGLPERRVGVEATVDELRAALDGPLPEKPSDPVEVIDALVRAVEPGVVAIPGPRYFGFVIGGALPVGVAADWLTSAWDQNSGLYAGGPSSSVVEEITGRWLLELFGLPATTSFAFVTGTQMSHVTGLAAARHHLLAQRGWNVEEQGVNGAPRIRVIGGDQRHATVDRALRYLGLGTACFESVPTDAEGRVSIPDLERTLALSDDPAIVCLQAGDVNSGAFDDIAGACDVAAPRGAWVHVDGAFGLWAAASDELRHLVRGIERADSWTVDGHKMLNVPYDSGYMFCAHPEAHRAAVGVRAAYLVHAAKERDQVDWTPEFSRRARGFATYAVIRALGRTGIAEMIERCCSNARRFADRLRAADDVEVLNEVAFNQVLVAFSDAAGDDVTPQVVEGVQQEGTLWLSGSVWKGRAVMRISVANHSTTAEDVDRSVDAILRVHASLR